MNTFNLKLAVIVVFCLAACACSPGVGNTNAVPATPTNSANSTAAGNTAPAPPAPGGKNAYPQEVADEFLKSCKGAGSDAKLCACLLDKIQEEYSFEEFTVIELKLSSGEPPEEFVEFTGKAKAQCLR